MLSKFIPQNVKTEINGKEFEFRPMSLSDHAWLESEYKSTLQELFSENKFNLQAILRMGYRLLVNKSEYKPVKRTEYSEEGTEYVDMVGGWKLFLEEFIGIDATTKVTKAIGDAMNAGNPDVKISNKKEEVKEGATGE